MRRILLYTAMGLLPALGLLASPALGRDKVAPAKSGETCGDYGTSVHFVKNPSEAARLARKEEKLVLVLHVSGLFENPDFTWNNAEALRVNALANPAVGKYVNENFVSSFQKVATFRIVGKQKQGGNVAAYFCAPDGRVLHCVAGPVDANTFLRESKWVVETAERAIKEAKGDGAAFKAAFRKAHAAKLRTEHGLVTEPITFDTFDEQDPTGPLTYRDPTGRPLAPKLPPPPIDGVDVKFRALQDAEMARAKGAAPTAALMADRRGRRVALGNQGRVHLLMAAHCMQPIERLYGTVFEGILGERISTRPIEIADPFPWRNRVGRPGGVPVPQPRLPGGGLRPR